MTFQHKTKGGKKKGGGGATNVLKEKESNGGKIELTLMVSEIRRGNLHLG